MNKVIITKELADELQLFMKNHKFTPSGIISAKEKNAKIFHDYRHIHQADVSLVKDALLYGYKIYKEVPIGVVSRELWDKKRASELLGAINRYSDAGEEIPKEWTEEYNEIVMKYTRVGKKPQFKVRDKVKVIGQHHIWEITHIDGEFAHMKCVSNAGKLELTRELKYLKKVDV